MQTTNRITELDIIRGVALLGILIVNMGLFSFPALYLDPLQSWPQFGDRAVIVLVRFFGEGKFISMFSFLFGLGFTIFIQRAQQKQRNPSWLFSRRLLVLLGIGLLHAYFIWYGDVLCIYSISGFLLLFFRNSSPQAVLKWAFSLLLVPVLLFIVFGWLLGPMFSQEPSLSGASVETTTNQAINIYQKGNLYQLFVQNEADLFTTRIGYFLILPQVFAMFLFGTYAGKRQLFRHVQFHLSWIRKVGMWSLLIGAPVAIAGLIYESGPHDSFAYNFTQLIGSYIGGAAFGIFYICMLTLLLQKIKGQQLLAPLAAVGRMAATNYIMQSILCISIFYSFGLGMYGKTSPLVGLMICIALYTFQVMVSNWWMSRFSYGPVEWLWRTLTYGKRLPIKR